jgi:N-glycosylase/DNA lyase
MHKIGQRLRNAVEALCPDVHAHTEGWVNWRPSERRIWDELTNCILSSQVTFEMAIAASRRVRRVRIACFKQLPDLIELERQLLKALSEPLRVGRSQRRYRFPASRARMLAAAYEKIRERGHSIDDFVFSKEDPRQMRVELVSEIPGLGPKQASMFLRNVGHSQALAILDTHVLNFMRLTGLCAETHGLPTSIGNYEALEERFREFSEQLGYTTSCVDRAVWVVMRVARAEALL